MEVEHITRQVDKDLQQYQDQALWLDTDFKLFEYVKKNLSVKKENDPPK